jgi:hypothetical protein
MADEVEEADMADVAEDGPRNDEFPGSPELLVSPPEDELAREALSELAAVADDATTPLEELVDVPEPPGPTGAQPTAVAKIGSRSQRGPLNMVVPKRCWNASCRPGG